MARPEKQGLDYFSHDINPGNDQRLEYIEAVHGLNGYAIYFKILEKIYANGYFLQWSERDTTLFAKRINVDINVVNVIIGDILSEGLLNKGIYDAHKVFTSSGIQKRYFSSTERRKKFFLVKEYLLVSPEFRENTVIEYINPVNVAITAVNDDSSTQSKVKESKVKESKVKKNPLTPLKEFQQKLFDQFWSAYPNKKSKGQAEKAWIKINPDEQLLEIMVSKIEQAKTQDQIWLKDNGAFIPYPATWLNAKGWMDEIKTGNITQSAPPMSTSNYTICPRCGEDVQKGCFIKIGEVEYCPKCPETGRVNSFVKGIGKSIPAVGS